MDGIAAIDARVGEIMRRIAALSGGPAAAPSRFASALATAVERQTPSAAGTAGSQSDASARMESWLQQAIAETGVPAT